MIWDKIIDEKPSAQARSATLAAANELLARRKPEAVPFWQRRLIVAGGFATAVVALIPAIRIMNSKTPSQGPQQSAAAGPLPMENDELLDNLDLLDRLDLIGDYDVISQWDGKEG